eukprot:1540438-Pyramimonas_sp.AAC.1
MSSRGAAGKTINKFVLGARGQALELSWDCIGFALELLCTPLPVCKIGSTFREMSGVDINSAARCKQTPPEYHGMAAQRCTAPSPTRHSIFC